MFDGVVTGLVIGLVAMGIVLVYRSTRVINFAVGNMGLVGAALLAVARRRVRRAVLARRARRRWSSARSPARSSSWSVIRRLFNAPRVIVLVATIGIAQLVARRSSPRSRRSTTLGARLPVADRRRRGATSSGIRVTGAAARDRSSSCRSSPSRWGGCSTAPLRARRCKASADNPDLARLTGINPKLVSTAVWAIAGLPGDALVMLWPARRGSAQDLVTLGPSTLVRALAAAVIAGHGLVPAGAASPGSSSASSQALISFNFLDQPGLVDFLLLVAVLVAVALPEPARAGGDADLLVRARRCGRSPSGCATIWWVRQLDRVVLGAAGAVARRAAAAGHRSRRATCSTPSIAGFALCALSVTVLTGWAGQLSLGQMAFAGLGALLAAALTRGPRVDIGWRDTRLLTAGSRAAVRAVDR